MWVVWLPELVAERIANTMPPNEAACTLRLVNKAAAAQYRDRPDFTTVRLSQPVPPHAFAQKWAAPGAMRRLTLQQRHRLLCLTAASGSIPNMEVALSSVGFIPTKGQAGGVLAAAAGAGRLEMCEWLLEWGCDVSSGALTAAARSGQQAICGLFLVYAECSICMVCAAARGGHPDLVQWLLQRLQRQRKRSPGPDPVSSLGHGECDRLLADAAEGYDLQTLQSLCVRCLGAKADDQPALVPGTPLAAAMLRSAAGSHSPDWRAKVEWMEPLAPPGFQQDPYVCGSAAAASDTVSRLTWLQQRGYALSSQGHCPAISIAAEAGNVAALEFLMAQGANPWRIGSAVVQYGLVRRLSEQSRDRLLIAPGEKETAVIAPGDAEKAVCEAARTGNLLLLQWAVEHLGASVPSEKFKVDAAYVNSVARTGNVEMLAWMHERGYLLGPDTFKAAAEGGCEAALEWLAERGCPMESEGNAYVRAACNRDLAMLRCLQRLGCPWGPDGEVFDACVRQRCLLPVLCWLAEAGCPIDWEEAHEATAEGGCCRADVRAWVTERYEQQRQEQREAQRQRPVASQPPELPPRPDPPLRRSREGDGRRELADSERTEQQRPAEQQASGRQELAEQREAKRGKAS